MRSLLGGKGANLAEMTRLGLPVPPGFIITTEACREYLHHDAVPKTMWGQVETALKKLEKHSGKRFGDPQNPLLLACRSGAKFSMPGMMDTVLNIGLTPEVTLGLVKFTEDARFAWDSARRLVQMFGTVVMDVPDGPFEVLPSELCEGSTAGFDPGHCRVETLHAKQSPSSSRILAGRAG